MSVRKAKRILKNEFDSLHPLRKRYVFVKWQRTNNTFLVETIHGERKRVFFN